MRFIDISISLKELSTSIRLSVCPSRCRNIPLLICIFIHSFIFFRPYGQIDRKSYKTCFCPWFPLLDASLHFCTRVCPSVCPSVRKSVRPYVRPSVCPSICMSVRPYVHPSVCRYVRPLALKRNRQKRRSQPARRILLPARACLSIHLSVHTPVCP